MRNVVESIDHQVAETGIESSQLKMHRHGDARIRLGDVDEIQSELPIVRVTGSDGGDILQCHRRKDEVDVSRNDELDATRVDC